MEKYTQHIELINQYINNLLPASAIADFNIKLQNDAAFQAIYKEHIIFLEGIKRKNLKVEIQAAHKSYTQAKWLKFAGISGGIILISIVLYCFFFKPETAENIESSTNAIQVLTDSILTEKPSEEKLDIQEIVMDTTSNPAIKKTLGILETKTLIKKENNTSNTEAEIIHTAKLVEEVESNSNPEPLANELIAFYKSVKKRQKY